MGLRTSGAVLGMNRGRIASVILMTAACASASAVGNNQAFYAALLSTPAFIIPVGGGGTASRRSGTLLPAKTATLVFSITAGLLFPLYIPLLAVVILCTRRYYRKRFAMSYPTIR
jgi:hypothetical protein